MPKKIRKLRRVLSAAWFGFVVSPILTQVSLPVLPGGFVFLVHPRVLEDTFLQFPFFRVLPRSAVAWILRHLWPVIGPEITLENSNLRGRTIFCPWTVAMMVEDPAGAGAAIQRAAQTVRNMGAEWLGTGALTASMTRLGRDLRGNGIAITTGHAATTSLGAAILIEALRRVGLDPAEATVAVIGGGGNIGSTLAARLADQVGRVVLIDFDRGGTKRRMEKRARQLRRNGVEVEISMVEVEGYVRLREADAVFTATSNTEPFIQAWWLKPGAIVVDDSQPLSMSIEEAQKHSGIVLQVVASTPGVNAHFRFQPGVGRDINYTCLAELVALATNGTKEGVTGPVTPETSALIAGELERAGYAQLVFQSFGRLVNEADWRQVREGAKQVLSGQQTGEGQASLEQ